MAFYVLYERPDLVTPRTDKEFVVQMPTVSITILTLKLVLAILSQQEDSSFHCTTCEAC